MRWCTISNEEQSKCNDFKVVLEKIDNTSVPECVQAENAVTCMEKIKNGSADLITLDGGDIYKAGKAQKLSNRSNRIIFVQYMYIYLYINPWDLIQCSRCGDHQPDIHPLISIILLCQVSFLKTERCFALHFLLYSVVMISDICVCFFFVISSCTRPHHLT